jgi:indolepyruvate ferredoxin oxidoreductase alpha subunit
MNGEEALVEALRQCSEARYAVPGYPVTTLASRLDAEVTINEKVALEYALGDSLCGRRAVVLLKNVGLNACADPLINATTQGLVAGVVVVAGDDLEVKGSQNAQDSRYFGELAQIPVIEPDRETLWSGVQAAFEASETFSRVALIRITPSLLSTEVESGSCVRRDRKGTLADPSLTMKGRAIRADTQLRDLFSWSHLSPLNRIRGGTVGVGMAHGTSHVVTAYPPPPLPPGAVINEFGRPFVREHLSLQPPAERRVPESFSMRGYCRTFCPGCPFLPLLERMKERNLRAACDMGCAILACNPPFRVGICGYGLGSSVAVAARSTRVALTGDYALLHSGINALIDVREKGRTLLCIVMKNLRMGLVGKEPVMDPVPYLRWADPVICAADDTATLDRELIHTEGLKVLVVEGTCPEGAKHGTVEC